MPVTVGRQVIHPGDLIVGDADGLVAFPVSDAARLIDAARASAAAEGAIKAEIANGRVQQSWITRVLQPHGL